MSIILNPNIIPKYTSQLYIPPIYKPTITYCKNHCKRELFYDIDMAKTEQQILPINFPKTTVYGYGGLTYSTSNPYGEYVLSTPGPTFFVEKDIPIKVRWNNKIDSPHILGVDPTLHWADPNNIGMDIPKPWPPYPPGFPLAQYPVPLVTHLHGGETRPIYDGFAESWYTFNSINGPTYSTNIYEYLNTQQSTTLFYHDHALGITRLNLYAGLYGAYLISDSKNYLDSMRSPLPCGKFDIPLIILDASFNEDGSLYLDYNGSVPAIHPYWRGTSLGTTNVVNGKVWPNLNIENNAYRFRIVNASLSRFYTLKLSNNQNFIQIATDGGYLSNPVYLNELVLGPAERASIIIDFSNLKVGDEILLLNSSTISSTNPNTTGQVMKFSITKQSYRRPLCLPKFLNYIPKLYETVSKRIVVLNAASNGSSILLNGQLWNSPVSEFPIVGSTQIWEIVNIEGGPHPIHLHLIDFQIYNRQYFDADAYAKDWNSINGTSPLNHPTKVLDPQSYLIGQPILPPENEKGWKDTVICYAGQVTRIIVPIFPNTVDPKFVKPGLNLFKFDPTEEPGYMWHCHIVGHEDNEMMRKMKIVSN